MNCPSRNDDTLLHPTWNQSPCHLTADLTTRQDLNGNVNYRGCREDGERLREEELHAVIYEGDAAYEGCRGSGAMAMVMAMLHNGLIEVKYTFSDGTLITISKNFLESRFLKRCMNLAQMFSMVLWR